MDGTGLVLIDIGRYIFVRRREVFVACRGSRRKGFVCGRFREGRAIEDGDGPSNSTLAYGCGGAARKGLDTKLLATPGRLGEFILAGTVLGSHLHAL